MGLASRRRPARLAEKLKQVRVALQLSQSEMVKRLCLEDEMERERISKYERGILEPPLYVLHLYSKLAGTAMENFVDDEVDLPIKTVTAIRNFKSNKSSNQI